MTDHLCAAAVIRQRHQTESLVFHQISICLTVIML